MTRNPDLMCAVCDKPMWRGRTSLPQGEAMCRPCRRVTFTERHKPGVGAYRKGCRCEGCRAALRERNRRAESRQVKVCSTGGCALPVRAKDLCGPCYNRSRRASGLDLRPWDDAKRDAYHRRRARKQAASTGRPVLLSEIRERDGNRCHLCRKAVSGRAYPHPLSASLDHVVPLSRGGAHDPDNVRLAHLRCNLEKGAEGGNEQLLLIG